MKPHILRAALALFIVATPASNAHTAEDAATLGARAEQILDHWDGDEAALAQAKAAIEQAVQLDPGSAHLQGVLARQVLISGAEEGGTRPSSLQQAQGILMKAALQMQPPDARVFAFLARVSMQVGAIQNRTWPKLPWAVHEAERLGPDDPWVDLVLGEYTKQSRYLEKALDDGLASPVELRVVLDRLLKFYLVEGKLEQADRVFARRAALDPRDAMLRAHYARELIVVQQDFGRGEQAAREALAIRGNHGHARETLSLALYGQWARAARDREGPDKVETLYRRAQSYDPGGHLIPTCLSDWGPLEFVYARLAEKNVRREQMHRC